ncbi:MAG: sulfurtransferase [Microbacteriaceae bacterium]|jgi:rhodanese-related sulfurtransferase|nr:sulfurtransferase [Microbacteriaceae bacterium]
MNQITVSQLAALDQATIIDVRESYEFAAGHVPGAVNMPLSELADRVGDVATSGAVHVICQSGGRSAQATGFLTEQGINAVDIAGGTSAWIAGGHPIAGA